MAIHADTQTTVDWDRVAETDLAYLAALIDGEGCIYAQTNGAGIKVAMTSRAAVEWAHGLFNGSLRTTHHVAAERPIHVWVMQRQADLLILLPLVSPYMFTKRLKAAALLELTHHKQGKPHPRAPAFKHWKSERDRLVQAVRAQQEL